MYIGDTYMEKRQSMDELCRRAQKWGKVAAIVFGIIEFMMIFTSLDGDFITIISSIIFFLGGIACAYLYGYFWYFGLITVRSWFIKRDISSDKVIIGGGAIVAVSYLLGGKGAAKTSTVIMIITLLLSLSIGFWAGIFNYLKIKRELARGC